MVPVGWLRPPRAAVEKVEALLDLGRSPAAIRAHHTMLEHHDDITLEQIEDIRADWAAARDWEMKRRQEKKRVLEGAKQAPPTPARSPEGARSPSKASPASSAPSAGTLQILQGGPSTWPREVVEHVQSLLALGWTSSKVVNHYSLQQFGLTPHQVDVVRKMPTVKLESGAETFADGLPSALEEQIRKLMIEGKTNTAICNHFCLANIDCCEAQKRAQVESVRAALDKEAWMNASESTMQVKRRSTKIKPPPMSQQELDVIHALIVEGRSNAYICNHHALYSRQLQEFEVEGVRRSFYHEQDGYAVLLRRHSPPPEPVRTAAVSDKASYDERRQQKKEHSERLRRKTAEKMRRQRLGHT